MKYKVGDRVKVRDDIRHSGSYGGITAGYCSKHAGKIMTITEVRKASNRYSANDTDHLTWTDEMFAGKAGRGRPSQASVRKYILITKSCNNVENDKLQTKEEILEEGCDSGQYIIDVTNGKKYEIEHKLKLL